MKLAINFNRKEPGPEDYSSLGFGATIEVEVPDDQAQDASSVQGWLRELYDQAKQAVEEQIRSVPRRNGNGGQTATGLFNRNYFFTRLVGFSGSIADPKCYKYYGTTANGQAASDGDITTTRVGRRRLCLKFS